MGLCISPASLITSSHPTSLHTTQILLLYHTTLRLHFTSLYSTPTIYPTSPPFQIPIPSPPPVPSPYSPSSPLPPQLLPPPPSSLPTLPHPYSLPFPSIDPHSCPPPLPPPIFPPPPPPPPPPTLNRWAANDLARSCRADRAGQCPKSGGERTQRGHAATAESDPNRTWDWISKRREGCKIVLLRTAVTNSISCNARFRSVRDRTNLISYIDASSLDGLAVRQPRGHWRHTPSPAQSPSRQMFRRLSAAIGEPRHEMCTHCRV